MDKGIYKETYEHEDTHWYFVAGWSLILSVIDDFCQRNGNRSDLTILDAGCGTGGLAKQMERHGRVLGIDISSESMHFCKMRHLKSYLQGSVAQLPFKSDTFDLITSIDVLYHRQVGDDVSALKGFYRVLKKGGIVMIALPAYEFLRSPFDIMAHTKRRYTRPQLVTQLQEAGFTIEQATYRNMFLFPLVVLVRILKNITKSQESDIKTSARWLNSLLTVVLKLENKLLKFTTLPFGSSVFCIARK